MERRRCAAITRAGDQCQQCASYGPYCYSHAPEFADIRLEHARKGGRTGGGEIGQLRREIRHLIAEVRADSIALEAASVILRAYRVLVSLEELRQRSVETDTLRAEIADLKAAMNIS